MYRQNASVLAIGIAPHTREGNSPLAPSALSQALANAPLGAVAGNLLQIAEIATPRSPRFQDGSIV